MAKKLISDEERFFRSIVELENGCWQWRLMPDPDGYGHFVTGSATDGSRFRWLAHRWAFAFYIGRLFSNLTIDHLCRNRMCVNPFHLEQVTSRTNTQRGERATATHCKRGHPFSGFNLMFQSEGKRRCRTCAALNHDDWVKRNPDKVRAAWQRSNEKRKAENCGLGG